MQSLRQTMSFAPRLAASRAFSTTPSRSLAKMHLIGRLAAAPEEQATSTGRNIIKYALGVSQGPKDESGNRGVSWFRVASFVEGAQKDVLLSLPKGTQMYVEADARMDTYQTEDGQNRTVLNLLQRNFQALSRPQNREAEAAASEESS